MIDKNVAACWLLEDGEEQKNTRLFQQFEMDTMSTSKQK